VLDEHSAGDLDRQLSGKQRHRRTPHQLPSGAVTNGI
jgi:hypothetical protein